MIKVKNLTKKFKDFSAVDNISFEVNKGDLFAFLGPNGAGKTTTIKMLTTLLKPTSGEIFLNNYNVLTEKSKVRSSFGIVFQDQSLDDELTAFENMDFHGAIYAMNKQWRTKRAEEMLKLVDLWERKKELVKNFSGGMKRRLEIARGLMHKPKVLFLDEPTLGLDPQTRNKIWEYISGLNREEKLTIFFTTHQMEEAERFANRIAIIDEGNIIARGSAQELKSKTNTSNLEDAFLALTGKTLRDGKATNTERFRQNIKAWKK